MATTTLGEPRPQNLTRRAAPAIDLLVEREAAAQALDSLNRGLIVADDCSRVLFTNQTANKIFKYADGLYRGPDGLSAYRARDTVDLRGLVRWAASRPAPSPETAAVLSLWRPSLKPSLLLRIAPVRMPTGLAGGPLCRAVVFLQDPAALACIDQAALSRLYGLTRAESHLVVLLLNGKTLAEAGDALHVTPNTVRTHLKHIFLKTETNRQTQLLALLIGSVLQQPDLS
ncbi:MAG: helix-turn-helix transcriptional regulator [Acidobacteriia bacterium]|nr:helix-turn-helix transcriptional regulator [Terriglobia bacterium]